MEQDRLTRAFQQSQQGKWTMLEDVIQQSLAWNDMWKMSPMRPASPIRSVHDQQGQFPEFGFGEGHQMPALQRNRDSAPCAQQLQIRRRPQPI